MSARLPDHLVKELDATGLPWRQENALKHTKIYLGASTVLIWPRSTKPENSVQRRAWLNTRAAIRRAARTEGTT